MSQRYSHRSFGNSTAVVRMVCAILFCLFSFIFLYYYQADVLANALYVWSGGETHYNGFWGSVVITSFLYFIQWCIRKILRVGEQMYSLSFFPSFLSLGILTDCAGKIGNHEPFSVHWLYIAPSLILLVYIIYKNVGGIPILGRTPQHKVLYPFVISNILIVILSFFFCVYIGDHTESLHYRLRAERLYSEKNYKGVLEVGRNSVVCDSVLTDLRVKSLAQLGILGNHLFEYPLYGNINHIQVKHSEKDIELCSYLIDKNLTAFASNVGKYYSLDNTLPKYYREALILYMRQHTNASIAYKDNVMDADFQDYLKLSRQGGSQEICANRVKDVYGNTYWYYFFFASSTAFSQSVSSEN